MSRRVRGAAKIILWCGVGAVATVIFFGTLTIFPARAGWVFALGLAASIGGGMLLALPARPDQAPAEHRRGIVRSALPSVGAAVLGVALSVLVVLGGPGRALPLIAEAPARITGEVRGMWDSALLEQDLAALEGQLGDRRLQNLYLLESFYSVDAYALQSEVGVDSFVFRDGEFTLSDKREGWLTRAAFTMADVDPAVIRDVVEQIRADDPGAQIALMYLSADRGFTVDVSIDGEYVSTSREFDARTGEELTEGER